MDRRRGAAYAVIVVFMVVTVGHVAAFTGSMEPEGWEWLGWPYALGTGLLGYLACASLFTLGLVPLVELLLCRQCAIRPILAALLIIGAWVYLGYYTLGDLGERPAKLLAHLSKSLGYGFVQFALALVLVLVLVACIIPL